VMAGAGVNDSRVAALDVATGQYTALFPGSDGQYLRSGHILYFFGGVWQRVPFDAAAVRTTGDPVTVLPDAFGLRPDGGESGNLLSVSNNGVLAYLPGPTIPRLELAWVDQAGAIDPLGLPPHAIYSASLSRDGRRIAMTRLEGGSFEVWVADVARKTEDRMDLRGGNQAPHWDPNGEFLAFISERKGQYDTYIARPDGSGERALLEADHDEAPVAWSHDGRRIIAREWRTDGTEPLVSVDAAGGGTPEVVMPSTSQQLNVELSPDDRWLAYVSDTSGRREVYVRGLARDATALRVSSDGGDHPYWSPGGRELFFVRGDTLMAAAFRGDGSVPQVGPPRALVTLAPSAELFGVGSDGRFLVGRPVEPPAAPGVRVVLNWFSGVGAPTGRE
jgi:eukaryotic-like serine/threonine-protein kinase